MAGRGLLEHCELLHGEEEPEDSKGPQLLCWQQQHWRCRRHEASE